MGNNLIRMLGSLKEEIIDGSQLEITNNTEIVIQGSKGIIEYTDTEIRINLQAKQLGIYGRKLAINCLTSDSLVIRGIISRIEWMG